MAVLIGIHTLNFECDKDTARKADRPALSPTQQRLEAIAYHRFSALDRVEK